MLKLISLCSTNCDIFCILTYLWRRICCGKRHTTRSFFFCFLEVKWKCNNHFVTGRYQLQNSCPFRCSLLSFVLLAVIAIKSPPPCVRNQVYKSNAKPFIKREYLQRSSYVVTRPASSSSSPALVITPRRYVRRDKWLKVWRIMNHYDPHCRYFVI